MRIELKRRHKFREPGGRRLVVETARLPDGERQLVERLVKESGLLDLRPLAGQPPDAFSYTFVIEDTAGQRHAATVGQSELSPALGKLVAMLVKCGGE